MALLNITLNQNEILELLGESSGEGFRRLLEESLNALLKAESDEQVGASRYERSEERTDSRNGTRQRDLVTRIGTLELTVPRHRNVPFKTLVFENYKRSEAALVTTMAEMVVGGVATAKVGKIMREICGREFSKSTVSEACSELDAAVEEFRTRPIEGEYPFVMADATYVKAREDHRVRSKAVMVAIGLTPDGRKEVLGMGLYENESHETWSDFLGSLRARGLGECVRMVTSDAHEGLVRALAETWPDAPWQRCQAHFSRNVCEAAPKGLKAGLKGELCEMFNCETRKKAVARMEEICADYEEEAPKAVERLRAGFDSAMTVMELPAELRRPVRTSNYIERLNREIKRRTKVVGVFPCAASATRLVGAVLMEEHERWLGMARRYYGPSRKRLEACVPALVQVARDQAGLREADAS